MTSHNASHMRVPPATPTDGRTDGRTNEESHSPTRDTSSSVTRTRTYGDFVNETHEATAPPELRQIVHILANALMPEHAPTEAPTIKRDPRAYEHRRSLNTALKAAGQDKARKAALIDDVEWMLRTGEHPARVAARLDTSRRSLARRLLHLKRPDLAREIDDESNYARKATA